MNLMVKNNSVKVARVSGTGESILYQFWGRLAKSVSEVLTCRGESGDPYFVKLYFMYFLLEIGGMGRGVDRAGCCWVSLRARHQANSLTMRTILTI